MMTSLKHQKSLFRLKKTETRKMKSNKKLDFDVCSEDDQPRTSSPEHVSCKNLMFDYTDDDFELSDTPSSPPFKPKVCLMDAGLSPIESRMIDSPCIPLPTPLSKFEDFNDTNQESVFDKFSPCRTRSGRIYKSMEKKKHPNVGRAKNKPNFSSSVGKLPMPVFADLSRSSNRHTSGASMGLPTPRHTRIQTSHLKPQEVRLNSFQNVLFGEQMDTNDEPPMPEPLTSNHSKGAASRLQFSPRNNLGTTGRVLLTPSSLHSPPTNEVQALKLFDKSPSPKNKLLTSFGERWAPKRFSASGTSLKSLSVGKDHKRKQTANVNPFTPSSMLASIKKQFKSESEVNPIGGSFSTQIIGDDSFGFSSHQPAKRLRVSDIDISRYEEEFVEVQEIATGSFGKVKVVRHCLDGMLYAIKMTRNKVSCNSHDERVAMNEVFAQSSLMKHKHIVRYYNSWVEKGHVYIQNEYCEGGSLANLINDYRSRGLRFTEAELKRILLHIAKGLQYIHSKQLVHLDIKPENIFIALDHLTPNKPAGHLKSGSSGKSCKKPTSRPSGKKHPFCNGADNWDSSGNESTDSGNASGCDGWGSSQVLSSGEVDERISYKIGDLGHVASIYGNQVPEEGDCRYMAPELFADDVNREMLTKADIFSLGLTLYEAASLQELPKNSFDDPMYERLKAGDLPFIEGFSKEFNQLLQLLVSKDENARPSASRILSHSYLRSGSMSKSRAQLFKELKETKARLKLLEMELLFQKDRSTAPDWMASFEIKPLDKSSSPHPVI